MDALQQWHSRSIDWKNSKVTLTLCTTHLEHPPENANWQVGLARHAHNSRAQLLYYSCLHWSSSWWSPGKLKRWYQITVRAYFIYKHLSIHEYIGPSELVSYRHMPLQKSQPIAKSWSHAHSFYMRSLQLGPGKYLLGRLGTEDLTRPHWIYPRDTDLSKKDGGGVGGV